MKENTNQTIIYNTGILFIRLFVTTICGLLTTRYALQALGITDFGVFSLIGSIVTFISILNQIMISTSNRFISIEIGIGKTKDINEQFNINFIIHVAIAIATLLIGLPLGHWYIHNFVNFDGDINDVIFVFNLSIISAAISFIGIPYNGLLMAKERFIVFSTVDVFVHIIKTIIAYLLINFFVDKLQVYAIALSILTVLPVLLFYLYCSKYYHKETELHVVTNKKKYKKVFSFSSWVAFGAFVSVGQGQGAAMIVNAFFNTVMNAAMGIANTVNILITSFASNVSQPIAPQITKSYAANNYERCEELLIISTKFTFLSMFLVSAPLMIDAKWLLSLWLGQVPPYVITFTLLIVINTLITSANSGISNLIFASGKIALYQIIVNMLRIFSMVGAYLILKKGCVAYSLFYVYIVFSFLIFLSSQWVLKKTIHLGYSVLFKHSYIPSLAVTICFIPVCFIHWNVHPLIRIVLLMLYLMVIVYHIGLSRQERKYLYNFLTSKYKQTR
jgi:O-antigen/teichoic acid export membrane protein